MKNNLFIGAIVAIAYFLITTYTHAATITVCQQGNCDYNGIEGIQKAIEDAKDSDLILIKPGVYKSTNPIVTDPQLYYKNCLIHTRGKNITLRGEGNVLIDNANGNLQDNTGESWSMGICVSGGEAIIEGVSIRQTLRPAIFVENAKVIIKNVTFIDIDHLAIDLHRSRALIINNLIAGSVGVILSDYSFVRMANNTMYGGGIKIKLCERNQPEGEIENNIIIRGGIIVECKNNSEKLANIKIQNNFVYHGAPPPADQNCAKPGNTIGEECGQDEICDNEGVTFAWPQIEGADEEGTICVWGEGWIQGSFNPKNQSITQQARAGFTEGICANGLGNECQQYIKNYPFPPAKTLRDLLPPQPKNGQTNDQNIQDAHLKTSLPYWLNYLKEATTSSQRKSKADFDLIIYIFLSFVYIMVMHFAINMTSEFSLWLMIIFFVLGGIIGGWLGTYEFSFIIGVILSLIFIGTPKKDL